MYIWLLHNLVGNKWIYSLSSANIGKDFDIVKEYTIIFKKETYVVEVQAYNEMGETKWTPVIEDEIAHPLFLVLKEIIIIIIIIPEILFDTEYIPFPFILTIVFLLLARQRLYKYNSVLTRSSFL